MTFKYKKIRASETQNTGRHDIESDRGREATHTHEVMNSAFNYDMKCYTKTIRTQRLKI